MCVNLMRDKLNYQNLILNYVFLTINRIHSSVARVDALP